MTDPAPPVTTDGNPFSLLAYIVFKVRYALETQEESSRPPRWVRICRGAKYKDEIIGKGVGFAVQGLAESVSFLAKLTLDLQELLYQTDAASAVAEVMLKMVSAVGDDQFKSGVFALFDDDPNNDDPDIPDDPPIVAELNNVFSEISGAVGDIERVLGYIPGPEDVRSLGHEFFRLLCVVQQAFPRDDNNAIDTGANSLTDPEAQIMIAQTGKIWPCVWAFNVRAEEDKLKHVKVRGLGADEGDSVELKFFGLRRLWTDNIANLPQGAKLVWADDSGETEIYDHNFTLNGVPNISGEDLDEFIELIQAHGYNDPVLVPGDPDWSDIRICLMKFQFLNDIPVTGELDNETLNRLMNLDYGRKNLARAVKYDDTVSFPWGDPENLPTGAMDGYLELINPGAENFDDEAIARQTQSGSPYGYYVIPSSPGGVLPKAVSNWPRTQGWIGEANNARGFVALRSRARNPLAGDTPPSGDTSGRFVGGLYSEGEAAFGDYFWAARHVEAWRPGRAGAPGPNALFGGAAPLPESLDGPVISRMFQWVELPDWFLDPPALDPEPDPSLELYIQASVLQRSLFSDRNGGGYPDQGRIRLELHNSFDDVNTAMQLPAPGSASSISITEWFPSHGLSAAVLDIAPADRKRLWTLRRSDRMIVPPETLAVCLIVEGRHQSGYDIDAYFDDFRISWAWRAGD